MPNSDPVANDRLRARRSQFRLISVTQSCALFSRKYKLPDWGFSQQEVTCMKDANYPKTIWRIESTQSELCKITVISLFNESVVDSIEKSAQ
jgi:dolichyl-phosphate-mannose-protein mannosyltransferase